MAEQSCPHARGDWIKEMGYWLCADCWQKMDQRPTKYGLGDGNGGAQAIIWQADIAQADGITLEIFLRAMVRQYQKRTRPRIDHAAAYEAAICALKDGLDPYGDPAVSWTADAARAGGRRYGPMGTGWREQRMTHEARRTVSQHGPVWWLLRRPDLWVTYAWRAAAFGACRPLIFGPPWEDCQ